ncbi:MAG TPA: hypothetical protein VMJ10_05835 [Kofleriaceae bacterium]|nr:hypothetical protein [Kofleriaceae bacterium]
MSPLAQSIYKHLLRRARSVRPSITYGELAGALGARALHHRSSRLHAALGELANACRHSALPCLPALVWRADTHRPSAGYYKVAHPRAHTDAARVAAWEREHARVLAELARFPPRL